MMIDHTLKVVRMCVLFLIIFVLAACQTIDNGDKVGMDYNNKACYDYAKREVRRIDDHARNLLLMNGNLHGGLEHMMLDMQTKKRFDHYYTQCVLHQKVYPIKDKNNKKS